MLNTPKPIKNDGVHSPCPSPPRPKTNFVNTNTPSSSRPPLHSSSARPRNPAPLLSLSRRTSSSTFISLASDSPSLALTQDDDDESSLSSSSESGFILAPPAHARPIFFYPATPVRNNDAAANADQQVHYPVIRLKPRRSL